MSATVLLDLDGTLLHEGVALPGAVSAVQRLAERGHRLCYATNDAVLTLGEQRARLGAAGFPLADTWGPAAVATAATVTAEHITAQHAGGSRPRVLLVGAPAVAAALAEGAEWVSQAADYVVLGLDTDLTYDRLAVAVEAVDRGAALLATNADPWYVDAQGRRRPGAGAVVAAVERATGRDAVVLGKPAAALYTAVLDEAASGGTRPEPVVVVGDSATDLAAGRVIGATCVAVGAAAGHGLAHHSAADVTSLPDHPLLRSLEEAIA